MFAYDIKTNYKLDRFNFIFGVVPNKPTMKNVYSKSNDVTNS